MIFSYILRIPFYFPYPFPMSLIQNLMCKSPGKDLDCWTRHKVEVKSMTTIITFISSTQETPACSRVFIVSIGYKAVSTTTPAVPPAMIPSAKFSI